MTTTRFCVGFGDSAVAIDASLEVLDGIEWRFREMSTVTHVVSEVIKVSARANGSYEFRRKGEKTEAASLPEILESLTCQITLALMESRSDLIWIHGAAAERGETGVLLAGDSGRGKSTIVTELSRHGWRYLSDDVVPWDPVTGRLIPFPRTPEVRLHPGEEVSPERLRSLPKSIVNLEQRRICDQSVPVAAVVFPVYTVGAETSLNRCSPSLAAAGLLHGCLDFVRHRQSAVERICCLAAQIPGYRLVFDSPLGPARHLTMLWDSGLI